MVTVQELFEACERIELGNAKIYAFFMIRLGAEDDRIADFWQGMSIEEWEHYIVLIFGRDLCARANMLHRPVPEVKRETLDRVLRLLEENERWVQTGKYTLEDAFEMAVRFEASEGDIFFLRLVRLIREAIERLGEPHLENRIRQIENKLYRHHDELVRAIMRFARNPELVRAAREKLEVPAK
ncbi:MAG: hypothetical protein KatS3mg115_0137 [Candidatus Poribacteria bacterium]|nr:MAG: hypothetical protein KatS3mg115_0137 [Candidatus Poribacteria bacterium]